MKIALTFVSIMTIIGFYSANNEEQRIISALGHGTMATVICLFIDNCNERY